VYEALWQRRFALVFGSASTATAAVLAAYFAGLAVGAWVVGNWKLQRPLRTYALLELGIAGGALLVEGWLAIFESLHPGLVGKTILAFIALGAPAFCMGGTLPALGAFVDRGQNHLGRTAGLLYVANTAGAAIGVLLLPFLLLPILGAQLSLAVCALGNLLLALAAWTLDRQFPVPSPARKAESGTPSHIAGAAAFVSGFVCFLAQIAWNRAFAQVHENSLYSFALIVAIFILALAVGGQISRIALPKVSPNTLLGIGWLAAGILLLYAPALFLNRTNGLAYLVSENGWWNYAVNLGFLSALTIFPSAVFLGMAFPAIMENAGGDQAAGKALGRLLAFNLAGATIGSLAGGFLLPQHVGFWGIIFAAAIVSSIAGALLLVRTRLRFVAIATVILVVVLRPTFRLPTVRTSQNEKLISTTEGPHGVVAVMERGRSRHLKLNNSYVLGGTASTGDERMQSHLPLLLHPAPKRVAYLGLGTGITASGALFHSPEQITVVELVPEVATAAREHFADANLKILDQPHTRLIVDDARNFLRRTSGKFDVIIGDLVVPWRSGEAALFTVENFQAGKRALTTNGIYCQWVPLFQLSRGEVDTLIATFTSVFPEAHVWRGDFSPTEPSLALIGMNSPNSATFRSRLAGMQRDPSNPQLLHEAAIWMHYLGKAPETRARINSENFPIVELLGPLMHAGKSAQFLFIGRKFQQWSAALQRPALSELENAAVNAGSALSEYTLALSESNQAGADEIQRRLKSMLPAELYNSLFPSAP